MTETALFGYTPAGVGVNGRERRSAPGWAAYGSSRTPSIRGAFALAGAVAAVTERTIVGLGVVNPYTQHPTLLGWVRRHILLHVHHETGEAKIWLAPEIAIAQN